MGTSEPTQKTIAQSPKRAAPVQTPLFFRRLDPAVLRELAFLLDQDPTRARHFVNPTQAAAELAEILDRGATPTIGWWRRHTIAGPPSTALCSIVSNPERPSATMMSKCSPPEASKGEQ